MGIRNRQRRAAKAKRRSRQERPHVRRAPPRDEPGEQPLSEREAIRRLVALGGTADQRQRHEQVANALVGADDVLVDRELEASLLRVVAVAWDEGWQPAELVRHARRADVGAGRLVATAVLADHAVRDARTLDPRWAAQVQAIEPAVAVQGTTGWLRLFGQRERLLRIELIILALRALGVLMRAGRLRPILPPPGRGSAAPRPAGPPVDDPVLVKVRALLAQAESTTFEAEAEAFTAKAQELMARHAIDAALLWVHTASDETPTSVRLPIDDPYADIKSLLLHYVAVHSRCTAVWDDAHALATVVGFASDLAAAELLYTSLLVQAQTALQAEGGRAGPGARTRSRGFRSSFLLAFTHRINERLTEVNAAVHAAAQAERTESLLPVLASRDRAVDDEVARQFAELRSMAVRGGGDLVGWARGTLAADLAKLNAGDLACPA
jgi:hypothetical protein